MMHDLLRDMGKEIVRREAPPAPGERSRLWNHEDVVDMLTTETGTKAVEGLILNLKESKLSWRTKAFKKMRRLRLLQLNNVCLMGSYEHISRNLRWLCWHEFPLESIPTDLCLENLVAFDMRYSRLKHFSGEVKSLRKLKFLNLSYSHELTQTPNFEGILSLEKLVLKDCISLVKIDDSIGLLKDLISLNLKGCKNLKKLPDNICALQSLEKLNLSGCFKIDALPQELTNMKSLTMLVAEGTSIKRLPETIGNMENLKSLSFCQCHVILPQKEALAVVNITPDSYRILDYSQWNLPSDAIPQTLHQHLTSQGDLRPHVNDSVNSRNLYLPEGYKTPSDCRALLSRLPLKSSKGTLKFRDCPLQSIDLTNFTREPEILELDGIRSLDVNNSISITDSLGVETVEELMTTDGSSLSIDTLNKILLFNQTSSKNSPLKAVSKRGINNTYLLGTEIPRWFRHKSEGRHISVHVPALRNGQRSRITAILTCVVYSWKASSDSCQLFPCITVNNKTKVFEWQYLPSGTFILSEANQDNIWMCLYSYHNEWKGSDDLERSIGYKDEIDRGDHVEFSVNMGVGIDVKKFGLHLEWD